MGEFTNLVEEVDKYRGNYNTGENVNGTIINVQIRENCEQEYNY